MANEKETHKKKRRKKFIPKDRCRICARVRVNKECKNPICPEYVPDKPKTEDNRP